jgi:broad specificity phosphatase PhoE
MKIIFMRHAPTKVSRNNFKNVPYQTFMETLSKKNDPPILPGWPSPAELIHLPIDKIWCSPARRALETAHLVANLQRPCFIRKELAEVKFDPTVISEKIYAEKNGFGDAIRQSLIASWVNYDHAPFPLSNGESLGYSIQRFRRLLIHLQHFESETHLCVTHGFLLRLVSVYFEKQIPFYDITLNQLLETPRFDHGEFRIYQFNNFF